MDVKTLESLADFVCGDSVDSPRYRSGPELTHFFRRVGFSNLEHDGSTRRRWTLVTLQGLTDNNLKAVILRLANPIEYGGDQSVTTKTINRLNQILMPEGFKVELDGATPIIKQVSPQLWDETPVDDLKPLPPPDFLNLKLEVGLGEILSDRWNEAQKCLNAEAYLAATIIIGSLLEGMLLAVIRIFPKEANTAKAAPKDSKTGNTKHIVDWSLSDMINVAHELGWIGLDVKKFSHSLREFRNLIHPYEQMVNRTFPDKDTSEISWLVVQAASNDLAAKLK
jgi:hypothetical protein